MFETLKKLDYRIKNHLKHYVKSEHIEQADRPSMDRPITNTKKNNFQMTKKHVNKIDSGMGAIEGPISP